MALDGYRWGVEPIICLHRQLDDADHTHTHKIRPLMIGIGPRCSVGRIFEIKVELVDGDPHQQSETKRQKKFKESLTAIRRIISPGADFSGEMYNHVKKRRDKDYPWLQSFVDS
ncbi:hypothetical protein SAMN03159288_05295 [Rhizobium sp. NFACC06-2]|nr:hypothetical protein SAMN03159288_05295 [Rhizobium sp. NFACC06-2]